MTRVNEYCKNAKLRIRKTVLQDLVEFLVKSVKRSVFKYVKMKLFAKATLLSGASFRWSLPKAKAGAKGLY